jgi:Tol biopolymer transport system component
MADVRTARIALIAVVGVLAVSAATCSNPAVSSRPSSSAVSESPSAGVGTPVSPRVMHDSRTPVARGEPIDLASLSGRVLFDDFDDIHAMNVDGSNVVTVAGDPGGPEFDAAWSPDGNWIVYRDSARGINEDDEVYLVRADGSGRRNLTKDPANDWGPDWSPDGATIIFNSDRGGAVMGGYLVAPDGSNLRRIVVDAWVEYPAFSPDGTKIAFMGQVNGDYEIFTAVLATGHVEQLTSSPGEDGWPSWSPDGSTIAFSSVRDDCGVAPRDHECWRTGDIGPHFDVWLVSANGSNLRRATPEFGQFVAWSPNGDYLLISGYGLYVVRPDGTGRLELRANGVGHPLGGIPDWHG